MNSVSHTGFGVVQTHLQFILFCVGAEQTPHRNL